MKRAWMWFLNVAFVSCTIIMMATIWRVSTFERRIESRASALRLGEYVVPLPLGTQVIIEGTHRHCYLVLHELREASYLNTLSLTYTRRSPEEFVRRRIADGWTVETPLQKDSLVGLEHSQVQKAGFIKLGKKLGYYFVSTLEGGTNGTLVVEWMCSDAWCNQMETSIRKLLKQVEVDFGGTQVLPRVEAH